MNCHQNLKSPVGTLQVCFAKLKSEIHYTYMCSRIKSHKPSAYIHVHCTLYTVTLVVVLIVVENFINETKSPTVQHLLVMQIKDQSNI